MDKETSRVDLIKSFIDIYQIHYFKNKYYKEEIKDLICILYKYTDKLNTLSKTYLSLVLDSESNKSSVKEKYGLDELVIILDKKELPFDNRYCLCMNTIITTLAKVHYFSYDRTEIDNKELLEIADYYIKMKFGFEQYIAESNDFRLFTKELEQLSGFKFKAYLEDFLTSLGAYIYYNSLSPELIRDISIIFMCHYEEVTDILRMNGFSFYDEIDNEYFSYLIKLILSLKNNDNIKKELL